MSDSEMHINESEGSSCVAGNCQDDLMAQSSGESTGKFGKNDKKDLEDPSSNFNRRIFFANAANNITESLEESHTDPQMSKTETGQCS